MTTTEIRTSAVELYPFQRECVDKLRDQESALIADDMGLGKTYEGIARDAGLRKDPYAFQRPTLIIAPSGTHPNWIDSIVAYHGDPIWRNNIAVIDRKNRQLLINRLKKKPLPCFVIIHYEALRLMPELRDIQWFHIIADEVHRVKNRQAQQTRALKVIPTRYKTGLSGTPADDKPQDFWSVLNWLWPKEFRSYWRFVNECCTFEDSNLQKAKYGRTFKKIDGINLDGVRALHARIKPGYVRRKKADVGIDLPPKYYTERHVELLPSQRKAYEQMRKDMIAWVGEHQDTPLIAGIVVVQLIRLQQFALASPVVFDGSRVRLQEPSSKLDDLEEIIDGNPNESLVVFSQSRSMVDLVVARLRSHGIVTEPYTGSVKQQDRDRAVELFQRGDVQVLAGTIAAGGEGITLHRASTVVFLDRAWNPTRNRQAEDRLHRIGQENPVQVIDIIATNTVDLGRRQRIANKWETLEWILGDKTNPEAYIERTPDLKEAVVNDAIAMFKGTIA